MVIDETTLRMLTLLALVLFGVGFNALAAWMERQDQGYTAFLVTGGVLVTLAGAVVFTGITPVLWVMLCFVASGLPMVIGSMWRYLERKGRPVREPERPEDVQAALAAIKKAAEELTNGW